MYYILYKYRLKRNMYTSANIVGRGIVRQASYNKLCLRLLCVIIRLFVPTVENPRADLLTSIEPSSLSLSLARRRRRRLSQFVSAACACYYYYFIVDDQILCERRERLI